ncbi:11043_t:CDS:2 [Funneliformis geosporum]|nr:11043_t:CDS:2 [Funneliformis geosporum]
MPKLKKGFTFAKNSKNFKTAKDNNEEYNSSDNEDLDMRFEWEDRYFDKEETIKFFTINKEKIDDEKKYNNERNEINDSEKEEGNDD